MKGKDRKKMGLHAKPLSFFFYFPVIFVLGGLSVCTEPPPQKRRRAADVHAAHSRSRSLRVASCMCPVLGACERCDALAYVNYYLNTSLSLSLGAMAICNVGKGERYRSFVLSLCPSTTLMNKHKEAAQLFVPKPHSGSSCFSLEMPVWDENGIYPPLIGQKHPPGPLMAVHSTHDASHQSHQTKLPR